MTNSKKLRLNVAYGLKLIVIILVLACCGYAYSPVKSAPPPTRDWTRYPAVVEIDRPPGDIFAVSDPHAHYKRLLTVLRKAGVLELRSISLAPGPVETLHVEWIGGNAVLVVIGDLIDKLPTGSLQVINMLRALQKDAALKGGRVIVTMGNHEAEFLSKNDAFNKKTKDFRDELAAAEIAQNNPELNPDRVANCEGNLGQWLCQLPVAARVGDWFFAHAGYTANRSIEKINSDIANGFRDNGFKTEQLIGPQSILEAGLDELGPGNVAWVFNGDDNNNNPEDTLKQFTQTLGVRHIVQGHKPGKVDFKRGLNRPKREMFQAYGLLFLIDADMGTGADDFGDDSNGAALRINVAANASMSSAIPEPPPEPACWTVRTQAIAIKKDGSQKTLWEETVQKRASGEPCR